MAESSEASSPKESYGFMETACLLVFDYIKVQHKKNDIDVSFNEEDVSVYWFSKDDHDWRVLITTTLPDNIYYRVTHSSNKQETTLDVYHNYHTISIPDKDAI
jgi:hypothetical protein